MVLTNQQIIDFIIDETKKVGKLHFRGDDLFRTFLAGKEIEFKISPEEMLPSSFIEIDYQNFKNELFNYLKKHDISFIRLEKDNLDIIVNKPLE